ncbi:MAG TPA: hypothetical protein VHD91_01555 [Gaiellaceae bacterium]|nr:hypothetical protein [Gaiellaceae bacterium]
MHEVVCDLAGVPADALTVDALARLRLALGRLGYELRLEHLSAELLELVELAGLNATLAV